MLPALQNVGTTVQEKHAPLLTARRGQLAANLHRTATHGAHSQHF